MPEILSALTQALIPSLPYDIVSAFILTLSTAGLSRTQTPLGGAALMPCSTLPVESERSHKRVPGTELPESPMGRRPGRVRAAEVKKSEEKKTQKNHPIKDARLGVNVGERGRERERGGCGSCLSVALFASVAMAAMAGLFSKLFTVIHLEHKRVDRKDMSGSQRRDGAVWIGAWPAKMYCLSVALIRLFPSSIHLWSQPNGCPLTTRYPAKPGQGLLL
ncbi:unnamed protein product [Arctogadus glacialis]